MMNSRGGMGRGGREAPETVIYADIADPCCCAVESNTIVWQACSNKKIIITHKIVSEVLKVLLDINS